MSRLTRAGFRDPSFRRNRRDAGLHLPARQRRPCRRRHAEFAHRLPSTVLRRRRRGLSATPPPRHGASPLRLPLSPEPRHQRALNGLVAVKFRPPICRRRAVFRPFATPRRRRRRHRLSRSVAAFGNAFVRRRAEVIRRLLAPRPPSPSARRRRESAAANSHAWPKPPCLLAPPFAGGNAPPPAGEDVAHGTASPNQGPAHGGGTGNLV